MHTRPSDTIGIGALGLKILVEICQPNVTCAYRSLSGHTLYSNYLVTAVICLFVQMFKYPNIQIFGCSKSPANPFQISKPVIFCLNLEKSRHVRTGCFFSNFVSTPTSAKYSNIQIYYINFHTLDNGSPQSIRQHHISLDICERVRREMQIGPYLWSNFHQNIHIFAEKRSLERFG